MKRGPQPKDVERRQRRNKGPESTRLQMRPRLTIEQVPKAPKGMLEQTVEEWAQYWTSDLACLVDQATAVPVLRRLFTMRDERERAYRAYRKKRMVEGSTGQPVINPMLKVANELDKEIRALEDRFGINAQAMLKMGIQFGHMKKTLDELNQDLDEDQGPDDQGEAPVDPRVIAIR